MRRWLGSRRSCRRPRKSRPRPLVGLRRQVLLGRSSACVRACVCVGSRKCQAQKFQTKCANVRFLDISWGSSAGGIGVEGRWMPSSSTAATTTTGSRGTPQSGAAIASWSQCFVVVFFCDAFLFHVCRRFGQGNARKAGSVWEGGEGGKRGWGGSR